MMAGHRTKIKAYFMHETIGFLFQQHHSIKNKDTQTQKHGQKLSHALILEGSLPK